MAETTNRAEQFKDWLELHTTLSPTTTSNYFYAVRKLLKSCENREPTANDMNAALLDLEKNEVYNVVVTRSAYQKYCEFANKPEIAAQLKAVRMTGRRKHPASDITLDEINQIHDCFDDGETKDVFTIQKSTGCRAIEAWLIERENVKTHDDFVTIQTVGKGGQTAQLVFPYVDLAGEIFNRLAYKGKRYPFLSEACQDLSRYQIIQGHYDTVRKGYDRAWARACKKAGLEKYASHDTRRAVCRAIYNSSGKDLYAAQKVLRHKDPRQTMKYIEGQKVDVANLLKEGLK